MSESLRSGGVVRRHTGSTFDGVQLRHQVCLHVTGLLEVATAKAEPQDRIVNRPIPAVVDVKPLEQWLVALEQLLERVQEQALAEAPGARQEVVRTFIEQSADVSGFIDVVVVLFPNFAEGLNADG